MEDNNAKRGSLTRGRRDNEISVSSVVMFVLMFVLSSIVLSSIVP